MAAALRQFISREQFCRTSGSVIDRLGDDGDYLKFIMAQEIKSEVKLEIVHVLFLDIAGYSKRLTDEQQALVDQLNQVVRGSNEFQKAAAADRLIRIPTGDGMALIFYNSPEQPVQCALEISRALKGNTNLEVRMGGESTYQSSSRRRSC